MNPSSPSYTPGSIAATLAALALAYGLMRATLSINARVNPRMRLRDVQRNNEWVERMRSGARRGR